MPAPKGNKNALGNNGGRPAHFKTPDALQAKIDEYFETGRTTRKVIVGEQQIEIPVYTICGLAYYLGFVSRQSFYDYENEVMFSDIIKRSRLKIEAMYEENLHYSTPTGSIFALKNMGWKDKTEIDQNIKTIQPLFPDVPADESGQ
jgi:hypothetical protein